MTIQEDLFEIPKMIKVGSKTHTELSILKAKWNLPKLEDVIIELLAKTNQNDEIQDINGHKG